MRTAQERKQAVIDYICEALDVLEGGNANSSVYRQEWEKMSLKDFTTMMTQVRDIEHRQIAYYEVIEFERDVDMNRIEDCAKFMHVPLYEHLAIPDITGQTDNVVVTPYPVPVGIAHYKRMPQTVLKKNSLTLKVTKKNPLTGQITSQDKTSRNTDVETYALSSIGAKYALREFMGPRADDPVMESEMLSQIAATGSVSIEDLTSNPENKVALNTLNVYMLMQGLTTNLVGPMGILPSPKKRTQSTAK